MRSARHSRRQSSGSFQMSAQDGKQDRYWNADWEETEDPAAAVYTGVLTESVQDTGMQNLQIVIREAGERGEELFVLEAAKYVRP